MFYNSCHRGSTTLVIAVLKLLSSWFYNSCHYGSTTIVFVVIQLLSSRFYNSCIHGSYNFCIHVSYNSCLHGSTTIVFAVVTTPRPRHINCLYLGHRLGRLVQEEPKWHQQRLACVILGAGEMNQTYMVGSCIVRA